MRILRHDLEELIGSVELDPERVIRENYSWSGGRTCLGLHFEHDTQWEEFIVEITTWVADGGEQVLIPDIEEVKKMVRGARKASVGRKGIIVFWPYGGLGIWDPPN